MMFRKLSQVVPPFSVSSDHNSAISRKLACGKGTPTGESDLKAVKPNGTSPIGSKP